MNDRYRLACDELHHRGCDIVRETFENEVRTKAVAVISTHFNELQRLAVADTNVFSTYYRRVEAGLVIPEGDQWSVLRAVAEEAMFPGYKDHIRFATLSLDGVGVKNYGNGECALTLRTSKVSHRASLFEDNNVVFTVYQQRATMADACNLPKGYRSCWDDREKLCVAKLAGVLQPHHVLSDFPKLLIQQGRTTRDDRFVEVHIWGPLTIRAVERVRVFRCGSRLPKAILCDVKRLLKKYNVEMET